MLGWEFPPHISGGLGTACYGMTKGLDEIGVDVCFVLPTAIPVDTASHVKLRGPARAAAGASPAAAATATTEQIVSREFEHVELRRVEALLQPYATPESYDEAVRKLLLEQTTIPGVAGMQAPAGGAAGGGATDVGVDGTSSPSRGLFVAGGGVHYKGDLMGQVYRYARLAVEVARTEAFDVIHAHDWMTYPAGAAVAAATGKPLVVHVHSTEFDRSGTNVNQQVYDIERMGMHCSARVVCVSHLTQKICIGRYGVPEDKTTVVYNAVELPENGKWQMDPIRQTEKIVLFLGRVTMQKGPEYFLRAAKKVVEKYTNVRFVIAGSGDMVTQCIREVADLKLGRYVTFTGFLRGTDVDKVFSMADLYVMPSVSEPFGIAPLEALSHNVPVIISKQSGVSEVLTHVLKVDFWDVDEMANKILAVLRHAPLQKTLRQHGSIELRKFAWRDSAVKLKEVYDMVVHV
jgi:glycosyltransferase involved in cell wall biosynthesis